MARTLVGSPASTVERSTTDAASSSMKSGFPSAVRATTSACSGEAPARSSNSSASACRVVLGEPLELQGRVRREPASPRRTVREELRPGERDQEHRHVPDARREHLDEVEQAGVRPVDVLEEQHRRPPRGERLDEHAGGEEERLAIGRLAGAAEPDEHRQVLGVRLRLLQAVDEVGDRRSQLPSRLVQLVVVEDPRDLLHVLAEGAVGTARAVRGRAAAQPEPAERGDVLRELETRAATSRSRTGRRP